MHRRFDLRGAAPIWGASGEEADLCKLTAGIKFLKPCKQAQFVLIAHHPHQRPENGRQTTLAKTKDYVLGEELKLVLATIPRLSSRPGYVGEESTNPPILNNGPGYILRLALVLNGKVVQAENVFVDLMTEGGGTSGRFYFLGNLSAPIKFIAWDTPPYDEPALGA